MKHHRAILLIGVVVFIAVCLASASLFLLSRIPVVETQVYPGSTPVHVYLSAPDSAAGWPLNAYIPVQAEAFGDGPIASIELYINGQLYERIDSPIGWDQPEFAAGWNWQPGTKGSFILVAKATSFAGGTGLSDPIHLDVTGAAGSVSPYLVKEGETLRSIAESHQVNLDDLEEVYPSFADPSQPIPADTSIDLPNLPDPVTNPNIIAAIPFFEADKLPQIDLSDLPLPESEVQTEPYAPQEEDLQKFHIPSLQDLQFWVDKSLPGEKASIPFEPVLKASFNNCDVTLRLANSPYFSDSHDPTVDKSTNESGFFIYRSQDGAPFKRVATLPAVTIASIWDFDDGYMLANQFGAVTYAISAFNAAGETMSAPVTLPLDQTDCAQPARMGSGLTKIRLEDGNLILPYGMDMAYLYLSINDARAYRVPEGDRMFQPDSGVKLNLNDYFNTLLKSFTAADFDLSIEVWGWAGNQLKLVGTYKTTIHRSVLLVCSQEGEGKCSGSEDGEWLPEINFSDQKPIKEQVYEFKWIGSQISKVNDVCYQFAAGPFPDDNFWNMKEPISSGCMLYIKGNEGTFTMYMGSLLYPTQMPEFLGWGAGSQLFDYNSNWFQNTYKEGAPFTLYARALPRLEVSGFNEFSNPVILHNSTAPVPSGLPPLASQYPSLYEVEILRDTYIPPTFETNEFWGCVIVDEDPGNPANVGKMICPPKISAKDDCAGQSEAICLLKGLGNAVLYVVDHFVYAIKMIKWEMTEAISYCIPYCHDYGPCYGAIKEVVEQIVYYGIGYPPNTDTTEDLIAGWIGGYMLSTASDYTKEIGIDEEMLKELCDDDCQKKIGMKVIQSIREKKSMESQNACMNAYQAYFHNREPMCLDPSIIVHPAEGSGYYPAGITIKITRKESPGQSQQLISPQNNQIRVVVTGSNDTTVYGPGYSSQIYFPVTIPVDIQNPGDSFVLNTSLYPCSSFGNTVCSGSSYSWESLAMVYFDGTTNIEATELCFSQGSSEEWVPCLDGGHDKWQFENPKSGSSVQP